MKQFFFILILIVASVFQGVSQDIIAEEIEIQKVFGGYNFLMNGEKLTVRELVYTMKPYGMAWKQMKSAQKLYTGGLISAGMGGFLLGCETGKIIKGDSPQWGMIFWGGGITFISVLLTKQSVNKALSAVNLYNSLLSQSSCRIAPEIRFYVGNNNIRLGLKFPIGQ
mgnify:CR=1 FL=1